MDIKYQIVFIGTLNQFEDDILKVFFRHINELGLKQEYFIIVNEANFKDEYKANSPTFCLYFGDETGIYRNMDILQNLIHDATLILPVVENLNSFNKSIPKNLEKINGFQLSSNDEIEHLVSCILEGLGLLRLSRRLFISYKRNESSTVAIQIYEKLEEAGFDVFLDTHSIRPGEPFQEELWHRLSDTDIVVLLNTPGFLKSNWTSQELAQANSMSIGILQLIWPTHKQERDAELSIPLQLTESDFGNKMNNNSKSYLTEETIKKIISQAESLRARSLASRQDNIVTEFIASGKKLGIIINIQPERFLTITCPNNKELIIIPTVGVPQAFTYNQSEELVDRIKTNNIREAYLLYDHRNIREKWLKHLDWLDSYLPIKTIKIVEAEKWLKRI